MAEKGRPKTVSIGETIQTIRKEKGFALSTLANETGFSKGFLEKVEAGALMPSVGAILQISRAMDIDSNLLLKDHESEMTRRINASAVRTDNYAYQTLTAGTEKKHLKAFKVTIDPLKEHSGVGYQHEGEEFVYVLSGKIELMVGENQNILEAEDSLHFNSGIKHKMTNLGENPAVLMVVLYVP